MEKLPVEILQNTFILLSLDDRVECLRVCRHWWNVLDKYSLFYDVGIIRNEDQFKDMMTVMERSPRHAAQVEELYLTACLPVHFNKRKICQLFPNVRILVVENGSKTNGIFDVEYFEEPLVITYSNSKIKRITDVDYCELASQFLFSDLCSHLEFIELDFSFNNDSAGTLLSQLKGLPVLKSLLIGSLQIGINDLEDIHNNLPTLQIFVITYVTILASKMPDNMIPLPRLKFLAITIFEVKDLETHIEVYKYVTKKYVNANTYEAADFALKLYPSNNLKQIYESAIFDFLKVFGPKKASCRFFDVPDGINVFEPLDAGNSKLEELQLYSCGGDQFFRNLVQSNQSKYITKLHISKVGIRSPDILKNLRRLTTISLKSVYRGDDDESYIDLTNYLNGFPRTVMKFSIDCFAMNVTPFHTNLSPIRSLDISCDNLDKPIGEILSSCFPKLVQLNISGKLADSLTIVLHQKSLKKVTVTKMKGSYGFTFKSVKQSEPQHYLCDNTNNTRASYDDIESLHNLSFISFTDKKLEIFDSIQITSQ